MKTLKLSILSLGSLALVSNVALALNKNPVDSKPAHSVAIASPELLAKATEEPTSIRAFLELANAWLDATEAAVAIHQTPEEIIAYLGSDTSLMAEWLAVDSQNQADFLHDEQVWQAMLEDRYAVLDHIVSELEQLAVDQPQQALSIAQNTADQDNRQWLSATVVAAWAANDAGAAMNWLKRQENQQQNMHLHAVLYELMLTDPASALVEIDAIEDPDAKSYWHHNYAAQLAETDPGAALQWADSLDTDSRYRARQATFNSWYWTSREAALEASHTLLAADERAAFIESIAYDLPDLDLALAQSVFENGNEIVRSSMAYSLVQSLYAQNPQSAEIWVEQLPVSSVRTEAQISLAERFAQQQPEKVLPTLRKINPERQLEILESMVWDLAFNNRNLMESWVIDGSLSQSEQTVVEDILESADKGEYPHGC